LRFAAGSAWEMAQTSKQKKKEQSCPIALWTRFPEESAVKRNWKMREQSCPIPLWKQFPKGSRRKHGLKEKE
jgi:hypothetical protein